MEDGYKGRGEEVKMMESARKDEEKIGGRRGSEGWGVNGVRELVESEQESDETVEEWGHGRERNRRKELGETPAGS